MARLRPSRGGAIALTEEVFDGITPPLTAAAAIDLDSVAAIAAELVGRPIRRVVVPDAEYQASMGARGLSEGVAAMMMGMYRASRNGEFARVDPTLARLIGRPPTTLQAVLKAALSPAG